MKVEIQKYPYNADCMLSINLDDLHPEGQTSSEHLDFGYNFDGKFWKTMDTLVSEIPEIKITLFTVANWIDRSDFPSSIFWPLRKLYRRRRNYPADTFNLADPLYKDWIKKINSKQKTGNYEIALHGLHHHNDNSQFPASTEFIGLYPEETKMKIKKMLQIFTKSNIIHSKGFRAPGWGTTNDLTRELQKQNILYMANASDFITPVAEKVTRKAGIKNEKLYEPNYHDQLINFVANCYPHQYHRAVDIAKLEGIIIIHAHVAKTIFGLVSVDKLYISNLKKLISEIKKQTLNDIWFATLAQAAEFFYASKSVQWKILDDKRIAFTNPSKYDLSGLTVRINNKTSVIKTIKAGATEILDTQLIKKEKFKVSVVLTVYNGEKNVEESLNSLCHQTYQNLEIIVVNDGSKDSTKKVLEEYKKSHQDERIILIHQKNGGRANARNSGCKKASGDIITFCEDDAKYDKDYIKNAVVHFEKNNKKLGGVIGPHYVWNKMESINTRAKDIERRRNFFHYKPNSCWFYRKGVFEKIGMFDETLELVEDVVPAMILKKQGYHFIYEPNCRWLHKEPTKFLAYLRRKFRGGVGMALLQKKGFRDHIVPSSYWIGLLLLMGIVIGLSMYSPLLVIIFCFLTLALLGIVRQKDIKKALRVSDENLLFIIFAIYIEYLWWGATFLGYLYGLRMSKKAICEYLKGR